MKNKQPVPLTKMRDILHTVLIEDPGAYFAIEYTWDSKYNQGRGQIDVDYLAFDRSETGEIEWYWMRTYLIGRDEPPRGYTTRELSQRLNYVAHSDAVEGIITWKYDDDVFDTGIKELDTGYVRIDSVDIRRSNGPTWVMFEASITTMADLETMPTEQQESYGYEDLPF